MFKEHKKLFMSFFILAVLVGFVMLFQNLIKPTITVGRTFTAEERPAKWKEIMADSINSKGINLVVDGKKVNNSEVLMSDQMYILIPSKLVANALNCAYSEYESGKVLLQKGDTRVELEPDSDYILVDSNPIDMPDACMTAKEAMYVRANIFAKAFGYEYRWNIEENTLYLTDLEYVDSLLPSKYNYVDIDKLAKIKNQGDLNICWATASLAAIETSFLPKNNYFLSAEHMALSNGNASAIYRGGDFTRALAYLAAWMGPVRDDEAFVDNKLNTEAKEIAHIQEAQFIEAKNYESIKRAVFLHGGVESYMYTSMSSAHGSSPYYNRDKASYCYIGTQRSNHAIVIVGWDDNYPKENFNMEIEGDGAFICMNSWGPQFGHNGIFYVSYYDSNIGKNNLVYTAIEGVDNYDNIYQSDLGGWVGELGYDNEIAYFANVYTAKDNEKLEAVSFYTIGRNTEYEIYIANDFVSSTSLLRRNLLQKGKFTNSGYYTVKIDGDYYLEKGKKYAIIVKVKTPGCLYPIAVEKSSNIYNQVIDVEDGEGYISLTGSSWEHVEKSKNCNVCLKMFTSNVNQ